MKSALSTQLTLLTLAVCLIFVAPATLAVDAVVLEGGFSESDQSAERYGGAARWQLGGKWTTTGSWSLVSYLELSISYWDGEPGRTGEDDLVDFGLTPVFRYQRDVTNSGIAPFIELGLGAHAHTETGLGDKDFDIPFSFGSHIGVGARFGEQGRYELGYRFQHLSNAGLGDDNPGINFHALQLGFHF